jgi:hypothetical protein
MSVNSFIPEIWSASILDNLNKTLLYGNLCNRDYECEIRSFGDTVRINELGNITINDYTKNSTSALTIQELADAQQTLQITRSRYFAFKLDDVDKAQTKPKLMDKAIERASYNMADDIDTWIAQTMSSGGFFLGTNSTELGSTASALSVTSTLVITALAWAARILDQNSVPSQGRFAVVSPAIHHQMITARIVQDTANSGYITGGPNAVGNFYGFNIYVSNNVYLGSAASSQYHCHFGHSMGVTFANQLAEVKAFELGADGFGDAVKGLNLYGMKITRPEAVLRGVFTP